MTPSTLPLSLPLLLSLSACNAALFELDLPSPGDSSSPAPTETALPEDSPDPDSQRDSSESEDYEAPAQEDLPEAPLDHQDPAESDRLFDPTLIHDFSLLLTGEAYSQLQRDPDEYVPAVFEYGELSFELGVRLKGSSTYESISNKPSWKIDINWTEPGRRLFGLKKFNLHNQTLDPSYVSEMLTYSLFREADLPAARVGWVWLQVNGQDYGLYTVVEEPDDEFLQRWFEEPGGNLYENVEAYCDVTDTLSCFDAEEFDEGHHDALLALGSAARLGAEEWDETMTQLMDWERFVRFLAMEAAIGHWDSYSYDLSNYRIYHQPTSDNWTFIPWSADLSFSYRPWSYPSCGQYATDPSGYDMGVLAEGCQRSEACSAALREEILLRADQLEAFDVQGRIDALNASMYEAFVADPRRSYGIQDFSEHQACIIQFVSQRPDDLRAWAGVDLQDR